ncbi:MAG: hypothetical protein IJ463_00130 [Bacilli bacterium]|nr:hypothetical protein [Bacilli bacterium]
MKKNLKIVWNIIQVFILVYVFLVTFLVININEYGYSEVGKSTYVPVTKNIKKYLGDYKKSDLLIIKNNKINKDDEIYYYTVDETNYYISKAKVIEVNNGVYVTDNNFNIDQDRIIGNEIIRIKYIGLFINFLLKEIGYFCFIILPMLILLIYNIYDFSVSMRKLNNIRIENIKRFYGDNDVKMKSKEFNDSIKKIVDDVELLDDDKNKKEEIEILDF